MIETDWLDPDVFGGGWIDQPGEADRIAGAQPIPVFEDSPAGQISFGDLPTVVSFHDAAIKVIGKPLPIKHQGRLGSCVGFGATRAFELSLLWQIAFGGSSQAWPEKGLAEEPTYGGSRVEIGGRPRWLGREGSVVGWAFEFGKKWGVCPRANYPDYGFDLSQYDISLCDSWGQTGVPDKFEPHLKTHPVQSISRVLSVEGLAKALAQGYAGAEGSSVMIRSKRGPGGITSTYRWSGHCMAIAGYVITNGTIYFQIDNSHGSSAHTGPQHPSFPYDGGALIHQDDMALMIAAKDTFVCGQVVGFPARDLDWSGVG